MKFVYKGVELSMVDMQLISEKYRIFSTMEFVMENYSIIDTEEKAYNVARRARELMGKFGYSEEEAVEIILEDYYS